MTNKHIGSDFDDFLEEEGILAEVEATAVKRVIAFQLSGLVFPDPFLQSIINPRLPALTFRLKGFHNLRRKPDIDM